MKAVKLMIPDYLYELYQLQALIKERRTTDLINDAMCIYALVSFQNKPQLLNLPYEDLASLNEEQGAINTRVLEK